LIFARFRAFSDIFPIYSDLQLGEGMERGGAETNSGFDTSESSGRREEYSSYFRYIRHSPTQPQRSKWGRKAPLVLVERIAAIILSPPRDQNQPGKNLQT